MWSKTCGTHVYIFLFVVYSWRCRRYSVKDQLKCFWNICHSNRTAFCIYSCAIPFISASFYFPRFCIIATKRDISQLPNYWKKLSLLLPPCGTLPQYVVMTYKHGDCDDVIIRHQWSLRASLCLASWAGFMLMGHHSLLWDWSRDVTVYENCIKFLKIYMWQMICFSRGYTVLDDIENFLIYEKS